jgi:hypothetical protein
MATPPSQASASVQREPYDPQTDVVPKDGEPSIAQLLSDVLTDAQTLIRKEVTLARQEFADTFKTARQSAILLGAGVGVTAAGGLLLLFALAHGITAGFDLPLWLSFLIVGALLAIIGGAVLASGVNQIKQVNIVPNETIDSLRKDL